MAPNRTFLSAPGNAPRNMEDALAAGADAVIFDLEGTVALEQKVGARKHVASALRQPRPCRAYVRVNAIRTELTLDDLEAVVGPWLDGIILAKSEASGDAHEVDEILGALERRTGMTAGAIDLIPLIETATGIASASAICSAPERVKRMAFGAGDYCRELNLVRTMEETELASARIALVSACLANRLEPPIDTPFPHIEEHAQFKRAAERGRNLGFQGKICIHPDQVAIANAIFSSAAWTAGAEDAAIPAEAEHRRPNHADNKERR